MTIEVRTCPIGHVHKYPADDIGGKVVAYYCVDCCMEFKPEEMKIEYKQGSYMEAFT